MSDPWAGLMEAELREQAYEKARLRALVDPSHENLVALDEADYAYWGCRGDLLVWAQKRIIMARLAGLVERLTVAGDADVT